MILAFKKFVASFKHLYCYGRLYFKFLIQRPVSSIEHPLSKNKGIDNNNTLAYVPPKFQMLLQAPVAQPG
jgi:hypothetical protein